MGSRVIAVVDWRAAALLKDNALFFARAVKEGRVRPRERRGAPSRFRSLTLREDGSCELQRFTPAAAARRLGGVVAKSAVRKTKAGERG